MEDNELDICEQEPIHIPGNIQHHGLLIGWNQEGRIVLASENCFRFLGLSAKLLINQRIDQLLYGLDLNEVKSGLHQVYLKDYERDTIAFQGRFFHSGDLQLLDLVPGELSDYRFPEIPKDATFEQILASIIKTSKFDRALLYLFTPEGDGQVVAESLSAGGSSFLNHWFPASDIPKQARKLYIDNKIRFISNVTNLPSKLFTNIESPIDLTHSWLRAVSPIHIEYLQNMNVTCSLSMSLVENDKLLGLIACHSYRAVELDFSQMTALTQISSKLENKIIEQNSTSRKKRIQFIKTNREEIEKKHQEICQELSVDKVRIFQKNELPISLLDQFHEGVFLTDRRPEELDNTISPDIRGVALVELPDDQILMLGRQQLFQEKVWGGVPSTKLPFRGNRIEPRKSFESFVERIHDCSAPWEFLDYETLRYFNPELN